MKLRHVNMRLIIDCRIMAVHAGVNISTSELESHYLAGGTVVQVVRALIKAEKLGLPMTFQQLADIDLAGYDPVEAVQPGVNTMPVGV